MKYVRFVSVSVLVVIADQLSKYWVMVKIQPRVSIDIIPGFFSLTHVRNPGGAFGFLAQNSAPWRHWLFLGAAVVALVMILYFHHQTPRSHPYLALGLSLIFGGAIGNLIDRVRFGEVVDFLDFYILNHHWPTFNVADSGVTVGVIIFLAHIVFKKMPF
jgi:signal peptidase II